ncbi:uncharacterized protein [Diadema antillarum]|uniref:uncharacterized protein n=1 Tax=Diadema antillarum TaxID=105358 RepID=UPI003A88BA07
MTAHHLYVSVAAMIMHGYIMMVAHGQTLNGPSSMAVERGTDTVLRCTVTRGTTPLFIWSDISVTPAFLMFSGGIPLDTSNPKYTDFSVVEDTTSSILTITATQIAEEGSYVCQASGLGNPAPAAEVTVEVAPTLYLMLNSTLIAGETYEAVCIADGSRPTLDIIWYLGNVQQTTGIVTTNAPNAVDSELTDTTSTLTFIPTKDNYRQSLRCETTGHQLTRLNQQDSISSLNVHYPPDADIMTVDFSEDTSTTMLTVTCTIQSADQPNPSVNMYYIYENVTDNPSPVATTPTFDRVTPDFETEYLCVGGNYLGNTTATRSFVPGNWATTLAPITGGETSISVSSETPTDGACPCSCPSSGMVAAVSIMAVLLAVSITVNVLQFYKQSRASSQVKSVSTKHARTDMPGVDDNNAYEMIESGSKGISAYQPLTPNTAAIRAENLTFFSRLGSIGLGKFGDVWKGELRTKQGVASVALRQVTGNVPDHMQMVKYLQKLPNHQYTVRCLGYSEEYRAVVHEFVSGGTLLTFLHFNNQSSKSPYGNIKPAKPRFDESKLLKFAWQIAKGMEFLASNKIIHGLLCAHNILMTEDRICKISDYGMTSFTSPSERKPTRWMSPEGMKNINWTLEGDVWSYGILLWEIVTLGARPYPKMTMDMVKQQVTKGYKMPRPSHCGQELYSIMASCWEMEPEKRCSYDVIQRKLEPIMEVHHEGFCDPYFSPAGSEDAERRTGSFIDTPHPSS